MERKIDIHKVAGVLISESKFLIVRSKGKSFFISPGGKVELGETLHQALQRELKEELDIQVKSEDLGEFGTFYALAQGQEDKYLQMDVFIVSQWTGQITPSNEVEEIMWVDSQLPINIELGSIFKHDVLPKLKSLNLIN